MKKIIILAITITTLVACNSKKIVSDPGTDPASLNGSWELTYIAGTRAAVNELYANKKPLVNFNLSESIANGNTGCNSFTGKIGSLSPGKITFDENMAMTKMFCEGQGETVFLDNVKKIKAFSFSENGNTLHLTNGDIDLMRLTKK